MLHTGEIDGYRQAVAKVLALPVAASPSDNSDILNTAMLGTTAFTPDQVSRCEALIKAVERDGATAAEAQQNSGCRAIGGILLRLGRLTESLDYLERVEHHYPSGINRARVLVLKSLCLHRLPGRSVEARAAFDKAEAIMQPLLLDHLNEREGFLDQSERTYLIHRREAMALLGGTQTNQ